MTVDSLRGGIEDFFSPTLDNNMLRLLPALARRTLVLAAIAVPWMAQAQIQPMQAQGDVKYVCGGIGSGQSTLMRQAMRNHPLSLMFVNTRGEFMASVEVSIKNNAGTEVLSIASSNGPICLIDIPDGRYTIEAESHGKKRQTRTVAVGGGPRSVEFRF